MLEGLKVLRDLVVVQATTQKKKTNIGYAMPDEDTGSSGRVVAIGPDVKDVPVGKVVYFGNESKTLIIKGQEVIVMELNNVVAVEETETSENQV